MKTLAAPLALSVLSLLALLPFSGAPQASPPPARHVRGLAKMAQAQAKDVPLEVKGDIAKVQVDKVIVVKEERMVAKAMPFSVTAPAGGILYQWQIPEGVSAVKRINVLEVKAAPKGELTLAVEYAVINWDARKVETHFGQVSLFIGDVTPPRPPPPPPAPDPPPDEIGLGFYAVAKVELAQLPEAARALAVPLADNFEAVAARLAANSAMTIEQANAELKTRNQDTLGNARAIWLPWFQAWQGHADKLNQTGALKTPAHYGGAYRETAAGLRAGP